MHEWTEFAVLDKYIFDSTERAPVYIEIQMIKKIWKKNPALALFTQIKGKKNLKNSIRFYLKIEKKLEDLVFLENFFDLTFR